MNHLKMLGPAVIAAMALTALAAGSASATTLEVGGVTQNKSIKITGGIPPASSGVLSRTDGTLANTCTEGTAEGSTSSPYTGSQITGPVTVLTGGECSAGVPTVHKSGQIYIQHQSGTTNGLVFSENAEVTVPTSLGFTVNCQTGAGTNVGTLTGTASGEAVVHINGVLNCGFLMPSATVKGSGVVKGPKGLGVSA